MEITNNRYKELVKKETTFDVIKYFVKRERGEISDRIILDHITWLMNTVEKENDYYDNKGCN